MLRQEPHRELQEKRKHEEPDARSEVESIQFHDNDGGDMSFEPDTSGISSLPNDSEDEEDPYVVDADRFSSELVSMEDDSDVTIGLDSVPCDFPTVNLNGGQEIDIDSIFPDGNICTRAYFF